MNLPALLLLMFLPLPHQADGVLNRAIGLYERGEYQNAVDLLSRAVNTPDASSDARFWLGKSHLKIRKWDNAVRELEKAVNMEPSNALYRLWLGRAYGARAENRLFGYNDARRLLKEFRNAKDLAPEDIGIRFDLLEYYSQAPGIVGGDRDKARMEAEVISKLNPVAGYTARATIHERKKEWKQAEEELTRATQEFPSNSDTHKDLAQFYLNRGNYQGSLASIQKALKLNPLSKSLRFISAVSRIELDVDPAAAETILQELVAGTLKDEDPSFEEAYYWLGVCYFKKGRKEEARKFLKSALSYNPDHGKAKELLSKL